MMPRVIAELSVRKRWWFDAAFHALLIACVLTERVSTRAADCISDRGCSLLAKHGIRYTVA